MFETWKLDGRTALVTGASGGLGRHFAGVLARAGATVVLAARSTGRLEEARAGIAASGGRVRVVALDVTDENSVAAAFAGNDVDILVNNAGITAPRAALDLSLEEWDSVVDTNLRGAYLVAREAARSLVARGKGGTIVNIASILGLRVAGHVAPYVASKAGLIQLTRALALEWARHGIRVNALCPGYVATEMNRDFFDSEPGQAMIRRIPMRRLGEPHDLDGPLLLLASDAGAYMTGSVLAADGGHLVSSL